MTSSVNAVEVAVFAPLRKTFHYLSPRGAAGASLRRGSLVSVPFGRGKRIGVVLDPDASSTLASERVKRITDVFDDAYSVGADILRLARWAADYYQHPLGEVIAATLPVNLRRGRGVRERRPREWMLTVAGREAAASDLDARAPRQAFLLRRMVSGPVSADAFDEAGFDWRRPLRELEKKGWVHVRVRDERDPERVAAGGSVAKVLNDNQAVAAQAIASALGSFSVHLLHGVTGSGKTEVYIAGIERVLEAGHSVLLLVPEIILTQRLVLRLRERFGGAVAVQHSGLSDAERADVWQRCRTGDVRILMGTRSSVWAPLVRIGLIIVDEEHDGSLKQQDGFRYHARDVAIVRAQQAGVPVVLGTATPSLETFANVHKGKYRYLELPQRAGTAEMPPIRCIDVRGLRLEGGLSDRLCAAIEERLGRGEQSLLFLNRRGFAPVILCHQCGWIARCSRCDANLVWHKGRDELVCHHCGGRTKPGRVETCCPQPELLPLGAGTEKIEETLQALFPGRRTARIDRDSMRRKDAMEETFAAIASGDIDILIGTQMLAKGHDFSAVTLVGIVDADAQLFSTDFRAEEKLAQLIVQVAGRAGRARLPGEVLIQTHHPHHELLQILLTEGYDRCAAHLLEERRRAKLPPHVQMALVRAESPNAAMPLRFLQELRRAGSAAVCSGVDISGPVPASMEKKAGRYRAQLVVVASRRGTLAGCVRALIEAGESVPSRRSVRWSVDIDPQDTL